MEFLEQIISHICNQAVFNVAVAKKNQTCLRKAVGCSITTCIGKRDMTQTIVAYNGSSRKGLPCTNVVGGCGCSHAEPRAVMQALRKSMKHGLMVCTYSPCTNCANIILDSKIIDVVVYDILTEHDIRGATFLEEAIDVVTLKDIEERKADDILQKWIQNSRDNC